MLSKKINFKVLALIGLVAATLFASSCKEEEEPKPAPSISLASSTGSGTVGSAVTISATVNSPGGLKSVSLLKNGQSVDSKNYAGETSADYTYNYNIEQLPVGSVVTFTLQATDNQNQASAVSSFTVTVSAVPAKQIVEVSGTISGNVTWTADKIYKLKGFVRVGEDKTVAGDQITQTGVLTIQPGTTIIGERATKGTLIVQRGSKIIAEGTADKPIVFTSERGQGEREPGDWGGLVICGKAKNNLPGGAGELEGSYGGFHGGTDDSDNSGVLKYVRVEFAGVPINPNQEVNSFTFGSVGSGTTMEYLQASYGLDDSFEWFGGTVNAKYLVAFRNLDDDLDVDLGYSGNVQYALAIRGAAFADQSGSNGFEVDNDGQGSENAPFTSGKFANISVVGPKDIFERQINTLFQNGMHLRRNAKIKIYNTFVIGYPNGVYIDPGSSGRTLRNAQNGDLVLNGVVLAGVNGFGTNGYGTGSGSFNPRGYAVRDEDTQATPVPFTIGTDTPTAWFGKQTGNKSLANASGTGFNHTGVLNGQNLTLAAGGSLLSGGVDVPAGLTKTAYIGAFDGTNNWTATWANFNPLTTEYK